MKKRIITAAAFAACLALCAAVWPQNEPIEETPEVPSPPAVTAAQPKVPEIPAFEERILSEEEKADTHPEPVNEVAPAPEPIPAQAVPLSEAQSPTKQNAVPLQKPEPALTSPDSTSDNMVYVPGFGWLKSQGPNHAEYAVDMYENGNKIGIMG